MDYNKTLKSITPDSTLKTLAFTHVALLAFQMLFAIIAFAQTSRVYFGIMNMDDRFVFIVPVLALGGFFGGYLIFKKQKYVLREKENIQERLTGYQSVLITRFVLIQGPAVFAIVAYILSGNVFFLFITALMSVYFIFLRPTREKIESDLRFSFDVR
jgi:Zn-dependent protease